MPRGTFSPAGLYAFMPLCTVGQFPQHKFQTLAFLGLRIQCLLHTRVVCQLTPSPFLYFYQMQLPKILYNIWEPTEEFH